MGQKARLAAFAVGLTGPLLAALVSVTSPEVGVALRRATNSEVAPQPNQPERPDQPSESLRVTLSASPDPEPGKSVTVTVTVRDSKGKPVPNASVDFYAPIPCNPQTAATDSEGKCTTTLTPPQDSGGTTITVRVEVMASGGRVGTGSINIKVLIPLRVTISPSPQVIDPGQTFSVTVTVEGNEKGEWKPIQGASVQCTAQFVNVNEKVSGQGTTDSQGKCSPLTNRQFRADIGGGTISISATASKEGCKSASATSTITVRKPLQITSLTIAPSSPKPGDQVTVSVTVKEKVEGQLQNSQRATVNFSVNGLSAQKTTDNQGNASYSFTIPNNWGGMTKPLTAQASKSGYLQASSSA